MNVTNLLLITIVILAAIAIVSLIVMIYRNTELNDTITDDFKGNNLTTAHNGHKHVQESTFKWLDR